MLLLMSLPLSLQAAESPPAGAEAAAAPVNWENWHAGGDVRDRPSLQRGARNFMNYCNGCHSLKYERYQRMADDLKIPTDVLKANLIAPGSNNLDYITTSMPSADATNWFGKVPPDLSLIARSKGVDYIYRFLKTFYVDPTRLTGTDNLAYPLTAMPAVLSSLEGVKVAVFRTVERGTGDSKETEKVFDHFETTTPGDLTPQQYDDFVRDTVNFLDYVGEPAQAARRSLGIWVVLFLLLLTGLSWLLYKEYWKEVH
jgi:ubiquinol-cytochrome c reductase cytochrome c1 subunit